MPLFSSSSDGAIPDKTSPVGIVAGAGELPALLIEAVKKRGNPLVVAAVESASGEPPNADGVKYRSFRLGEASRVLEYLKSSGVRHVFLAGGIPKKKIYREGFEADALTRRVLGGLKEQGDAKLLAAVLAVLKLNGIRLLHPAEVLRNRVMPKGSLTKRRLTPKERSDVNLGLKVAARIGGLDIGQAVAVKEGVVLAVEAIEGTDNMLDRVGSLGVRGAVMVKCAKPRQDLRLDMPVFGVETVRKAAQNGIAVIAAEAGRTLFLNRENAVRLADEKNICIVGI